MDHLAQEAPAHHHPEVQEAQALGFLVLDGKKDEMLMLNDHVLKARSDQKRKSLEPKF